MTGTPTPSLPRRGPGVLHQGEGTPPTWGGRKASQFVALCLSTYGTTCWLCGLPGATTADHVIPRARGGAVYELLNLAPAHKSCNESRGKRDRKAEEIIEDGREFFSRE